MILPDTVRLLGFRHVEISNTAPSSCFMDPIEEHFSQVAAMFHGAYSHVVIERELGEGEGYDPQRGTDRLAPV
jgi:hypothetical protein